MTIGFCQTVLANVNSGSRSLCAIARPFVCRLSIAILDLSNAISRKRCKKGAKLVLITDRKSYMSFRSVPKSATLNDPVQSNGRYIALFH